MEIRERDPSIAHWPLHDHGRVHARKRWPAGLVLYGAGGALAAGAAAGRFVRRRVAEPAFQDVTHVSIVRATSAALMPSNASPYPTPSSIMRRSF